MSYLKALPFILLPFFIFSCQDPETPDTTGPEITALSPSENAKVNGTATISVTVEDLSDEVNLQVFVDDQLIKEQKAKQIDASVNTKSLSEGPHTVKVTATDKAGNVTTKTFSVDVRNILFKLQVPSNYVDEWATIYRSISRNDGSLIALFQMENGKTISINTPDDFNADSSFVVTQYFFLNVPYYRFHVVDNYAGIKAGEFKLPAYVSRSVVGEHDLEISDVPLEPQQQVRFGGSQTSSTSGSFGDQSPIKTKMSMLAASSELFLSFFEQSEKAPVYKFINSIETGGSTKVSFSDFIPMTRANVSLTFEGYHSTVTGFKDASSEGVRVFEKEGAANDKQLPLYYPGNVYPAYSFLISSNGYSNLVTGTTPPTAIKELSGEIKNLSLANGKLALRTSGDFDLVSVSTNTFSYDEASGQNELYVSSVWFPAGNSHHITLPPIPQQLSDYNFPMPTQASEFKFGSMTDYLSLSGQNDYQSKVVFSSDNKFPADRDNYTKTLVVNTTGGRVRSTHLPKEVQERLKRYLPMVGF